MKVYEIDCILKIDFLTGLSTLTLNSRTYIVNIWTKIYIHSYNIHSYIRIIQTMYIYPYPYWYNHNMVVMVVTAIIIVVSKQYYVCKREPISLGTYRPCFFPLRAQFRLLFDLFTYRAQKPNSWEIKKNLMNIVKSDKFQNSVQLIPN